jgi:hypothetical protein
MSTSIQVSITGLWEGARTGKPIEFVELQAGTNLMPAPPRFTFGTFPADLAAGYFRNTHLWAMGVYRLHGFDVFGPYALSKDGTLFCCHEANIHPKHIEDVVAELGPPNFPRPRRFVTGRVAMITGPGHTVYGHWLSDFLPKLWLLQASGHDIRRLHYLLPSDTPRFGRDWMDLVGIPPENVILFDPKGEMIWIEELLVPTTIHNGIRGSDMLSDAATFLITRVGDHAGEPIPANPHRRLFLSRARTSQSRSLMNRQRIEEIAASAGLEFVYPEALPLIEQVRLFGEASMIVGEYGSAMHGSLFSPSGATVCALRGSLGHPGFIQSAFGHALKQPTGYVFGTTDDEETDGRFVIPEDVFVDCLTTLLGGAGLERT